MPKLIIIILFLGITSFIFAENDAPVWSEEGFVTVVKHMMSPKKRKLIFECLNEFKMIEATLDSVTSYLSDLEKGKTISPEARKKLISRFDKREKSFEKASQKITALKVNYIPLHAMKYLEYHYARLYKKYNNLRKKLE